ncbi:hypothetical protein BJX61DRAFT_547760 [Aspergillus egyptiacus]|nr:hypothetical protein BJX61DRAFT_547760 [Aspergillus egyptiacus]
MIDAQARLCTEIALSVSLTILDDNGFGVDLALKVPELTVTTAAGVDTNGFCDVGGNPWGVNIEASVGANLMLEGWKELDGGRDILFYSNRKTYTSSLISASPLASSQKATVSVRNPKRGWMGFEELDPEEITEDEEMGELAARSMDVTSLTKRQRQSSPNKIFLDCGGGTQLKYRVLNYSTPYLLHDNESVPMVVPLVGCGQQKDCVPNSGIRVLTNEHGKPPRAAAFVKGDDERRTWTTEHIYEGAWIKEFLGWLHINKINGGTVGNETCTKYVTQLFDTKNTPLDEVPKPVQAKPPNHYVRSLLQKPGNEDSRDPPTPNNHERRVCDIARIVTTCKYMDAEVVRKGLLATVNGIEGVLAVMDGDSIIEKPAGFSWVAAHQDWIKNITTEGIKHARARLVDYAKWMVPEEIREIASGSPAWDKYCPTRPREQW